MTDGTTPNAVATSSPSPTRSRRVPQWVKTLLLHVVADVSVVLGLLWVSMSWIENRVIDRLSQGMELRAERLGKKIEEKTDEHLIRFGKIEGRFELVESKLPALGTLSEEFLDRLGDADPKDLASALKAIVAAEDKSPGQSFIKMAATLESIRGDLDATRAQLARLQKGEDAFAEIHVQSPGQGRVQIKTENNALLGIAGKLPPYPEWRAQFGGDPGAGKSYLRLYNINGNGNVRNDY